MTTLANATGAKETIERTELATTITDAGQVTMRIGLVIIIGWIGGMKFTAYESEAISGFVRNSPLMSWVYSVTSQQNFSSLLGVVEIAIAVMISARYLSPLLSAVGSLLAVGMFLTTLTFLLSTPDCWVSGAGFPMLAVPGQFVIKDLALLGISIWSVGEALSARPE